MRGLMLQARSDAQAEKPRTGVLADAEKLEERLVWMQGFIEKDSVRADPGDGRSAREVGRRRSR